MKFFGEYWFLNNSAQYPMDLEIDGKKYRFGSAEAAFQACKAPVLAEQITQMGPKEAKAASKKFKKREVREDWDDVKLLEMKRVLTAKFKNPTLRHKLLQCGGSITMENDYHDTYWGLFNGRGQNIMGKLLEEVREDIRKEMGLVFQKETSVVSYKIQQGGLVAFDTETTGLSAKYDDILQITIVGQDGSILLDTYVKPQNCTHWEDSQKVHGISPEMVKNAPSAEKVAEVVRKIFDNADKIIGYNVPFDRKMTEARFGYDFVKKELEMRKKYPDQWKERIKTCSDDAYNDRDDYKQAVEEMNWLSLEKKRLRTELKEELCLSSVKELDAMEPVDNEKYREYRKVLDYIDNAESVIAEKKLSRCYKIMERYGIPLEEATDRDIKKHIEEITPPMSLEDILPLYKTYTRKIGESVPHKLVHAMKMLCPEKADTFLMNAHDAAADTIATMEIAKELYNAFDLPCPIGKSTFEDKLFGITEGIVCHQVSCDGLIQKGFSSRMYGQFPKLRRDYFATVRSSDPDSLFGKIKIGEADTNLFVASIFSRHTQGNAEQDGIQYTNEKILVSRVAAICDKFPDKAVYLPVVHETESEDNTFKITDGIGAGKGGGNWSRLESQFKNLKKKNLFFLDTQTGEIKATCDLREGGLQHNVDEPEKASEDAIVPVEEDNGLEL